MNENYLLEDPPNRIISFSVSTVGFLNFWLAFLERKKIYSFGLPIWNSLTISENQPSNPPVIIKIAPTMTCIVHCTLLVH
jgi:hypothetical protein